MSEDRKTEPTKEDIEMAQFRGAQVQMKVQEQGSILETLQELRRTRKARGAGAPLIVPRHLSDTAAIIITDADVEDALKNR